MWKTKTKIVHTIIGCTDFVYREYIKHIEPIPGDHSLVEIQKTAILGTSNMLKKLLL